MLTYLQGIEERDEADCVFFVDVDLTRDSDKEVSPTDNKQSGSDDGDIPLFVFAGS